jgi:hypothetical protein
MLARGREAAGQLLLLVSFRRPAKIGVVDSRTEQAVRQASAGRLILLQVRQPPHGGHALTNSYQSASTVSATYEIAAMIAAR